MCNAHIRQQWAPIVQAVIAACQGGAEAAAQMEPFLEQLSQQEKWRELASVLRRILAGERDPQTLLAGLDTANTVIVSDVLRALGVELAEERGMSLDELLVSPFSVSCLIAPQVVHTPASRP